MKRFFILTALMAVLGLSSCEKEPSKAIIGTWEAYTLEISANGVKTSVDLNEANMVMLFTFKADGSGSSYVETDGEGERSTFEYEVFGDTLTMTIDGSTESLKITFEKDTLIAEIGENIIGQENVSIKLYFKKA